MLIGLPLGLILAALVNRFLSTLLYGVTPGDPMTFVVIALLVASITLLASYLLARRALRIDPVEPTTRNRYLVIVTTSLGTCSNCIGESVNDFGKR